MVIRPFIDSDVVISSLLSSSGAAHFLLRELHIKPVISSISLRELHLVAKRLNIKTIKLETLVNNQFEVITLAKSLPQLRKIYQPYVSDVNDAHIVAGAHSSKAKYLITYNLKHYKSDLIKDKLRILLLTPALFMQYLRSQE